MMVQAHGKADKQQGTPSGVGRRIGIVAALWHGEIVDAMLQSALLRLHAHGVPTESIIVVRCPGSYEIPICAKAMAIYNNVDAVIALGVIIRGETAHFEYVSSPLAHSLMDVSVQTGVPCLFGVLTTETLQQAEDRAGGIHGNKGAEAAEGALVMAEVLDTIRGNKP